MKIDFNEMEAITIPKMNGGTGEITACMHMGEHGKLIFTRIHPGSSIGMHKQESGDDINFVISGSGIAICDGVEESLGAGVCHVCPKGSEHSIINSGENDLVLLSVVVDR